MDVLKKALGNAPVFLLAYIVFMVPTYVLPYAGSNSAMFQAAGAAFGARGSSVPFWLHLGCMLVLCILCRVRGQYMEKGWLLVFPVLAMVFDFVPFLSAIPLIPTVMHLLALVLGVIATRGVVAAPPVAGGGQPG